jgi:hypothetical protein
MKNVQHFFRAFFLLCAFSLLLSSFSQTTEKGYNIVYKTQNTKDKLLYLTGIYGNNAYLIDSAKYSKKGYVFKNSKQILPDGFYYIKTKNGNVLVDFFIEQTRKFSIVETDKEIIFHNSEENLVYQQFKKDLWADNDLRIYHYTAPESLLGKFILAQYVPVSVPSFNWGSHDGQAAAAQKYYQFLIAHYYDNVDFKDYRLMYTPLDIDLKDFFFELLYPQTAENVIQSVENLFHRILDEVPTPEQYRVRDFYLKKLIHLYISAEPKFDEVFVYLVDNYVATLTQSQFISEAEIGVFKRVADRKRKTLEGSIVPVFESFTNEHYKVSTADINANYTLLWFWDPDCEHCTEYTPIMYDFYTKYHELYNFEVIACSVTEDYDRWLNFINEYPLWLNTSYAIETPNYDATDFFNFNETPALFIIDKNHKIVARQFPLDDLFEIFESLTNNK